MANDINKEDPHYKGEYSSIYEVNRKFPTGGVAGDFVVIDGWAHYWNADRGTWCVNAERDSYWDELITNIIENFKPVRGATYMGVASLDTVPDKAIGAKMYYFATVAGTYENFNNLVVPQGINVLYSENGSSWVNTTLLEVAQELGVSTNKVVSQKTLNDALNLKADQSSVNEALAKKADNKRVDDELAKKFDKQSVVQEFGDSEDKVVSQFALPFREIESPEFIKAIVDAEDHFLFGIQLDGSIEWGKGIPAPIRAKLQEIINQCQQDKTDILETINAAKKELSASIAALQEGKVDKEEGKSLIEDEVKECFRVIENEEFIYAVIDSEDRLLFGIYRATGKPYFPLNEMYHVEQNEEFLWIILDAANHPLLGIQQDGTCWAAKAQWLDDIKAIKEALSSIDETLKTFQPKEDGKGLINLNVADSFFYISNDEYIIAVVDAENRILAGIKYDAQPYFPNHEMYSVVTNEEWLYAIIDAENKVLGGFRSDDGHMVVGGIDISTFIANAIIDIADIKERTAHLSTIVNDEYLSVETDAEGKVIGYTAPDGSHYLYKVKSETIPTEFEHIEDSEGRTEITMDADNKILSYRDNQGIKHEQKSFIHSLFTDEINGIALDVLKSHNVSPRTYDLPAYGCANIKKEIFYEDSSGTYYPSFDIVKIENSYYVKASLTNGLPNDSSISVTQKIDVPQIQKWRVDKKCEHQCIVDIDFGNYLSGEFYVVVKYQGSSTLQYVKKNFRFTFYKDNLFAKKMKIKIGEMLRQSSFNLKAYYADPSKLAEPILQRMILAERETRDWNDQFPWNKDYIYNTGATGMIKSFPIRLEIGGTFYGVEYFGLKKDESNYMLDSKKDNGIFVSGTRNDSSCWTTAEASQWEDEMQDEMTESTKNALNGFFAYINSTDFTKESASQHLSVLDWIDYYINCEVFMMYDSLCRNMILYSGEDKKVFYPFFYDMDLSLFSRSPFSILEVAYASDRSIWDKLISMFWDDIVLRYNQLRLSILNPQYFKAVVLQISNSIDFNDFNEESKLYPKFNEGSISSIFDHFEYRLALLDKYFV